MSRLTPAQQQVDLASFWDRTDRRNGGDGLVWAKSTAPAGQQVIVHIENANKQRFKVPPIKAGNPVCLTSFAPFDVLRDSADLNQCATGGGSASGQPLVRLMTTKEADEFFDKKAKTLKRTKDDLKREAARVQMQEAQARKLAPSEVDTNLRIQDAVVSIQDVINPYIEDLCAQIRPDLDANMRMSASDFMSAMLDLEDSLSFDEVEYIYTHSGIYPSVRSWAAKKKDEIWAASADSAQAYDDLADDVGAGADEEGEDASESEDSELMPAAPKSRSR